MALIEGVGDEVTLLFALVLLLSVVVLAWVSTHTSERSGTHGSSSSSRVEDRAAYDVPSSSDDSPPSSDTSLHARPLTSDTPGDSADRATLLVTEGPQEPPNSPETEAANPSTLRHRGPGAPSEDTEHRDTISLRLKFLNDTERLVTACPSDTILHIKRAQFPGQEGQVRLIYQGQLLRDDSQTVASLQLTDGCVVHCHVSQHAPSPGHSSMDLPEVPLNVGSLLVPLLVLILALLWYCQFEYPHLFTATATVCLGAITLLVIVIALAMYRR